MVGRNKPAWLSTVRSWREAENCKLQSLLQGNLHVRVSHFCFLVPQRAPWAPCLSDLSGLSHLKNAFFYVLAGEIFFPLFLFFSQEEPSFSIFVLVSAGSFLSCVRACCRISTASTTQHINSAISPAQSSETKYVPI